MGFHNVVKGNRGSANRFGIIVAGSPCAIRSKFNVVEKNIVTDNEVMGIYFAWYADNNICERNFVQSNSIGIILLYASFNNVTHNLIIGNDYGIQAAYSEYNCVEKNVVERNDCGIEITAFSQWNNIKRNVAILNRNYGIGVTGANTHFNTIARKVVLLNAEFDLYWDGEDTGNIWAKNKYRTKNW